MLHLRLYSFLANFVCPDPFSLTSVLLTRCLLCIQSVRFLRIFKVLFYLGLILEHVTAINVQKALSLYNKFHYN